MSMNLQTAYTETPPVAFQGQLYSTPKRTIPAKQAEASAHVPFGMPLAYKPSGATTDLDATIPANSTDVLMGILYRSDAYAPAWTDSNGTQGELDSTGLLPGVMMDLLEDGELWVTCQTGCSPGDRLYVSYSAGSTYTAAGQLGNAAEASHTIDATTKGEWRSTASAGGLARLRVMFANK